MSDEAISERLFTPGFNLRAHVRAYEAELIALALAESGGEVTRAARLLGLKHQTLCHKLKTAHKELARARQPVRPRFRSLIRRTIYDLRPPRRRRAPTEADEAQAAELLRAVAALVPAELPMAVREEAAQAIAVDLWAGVVKRAELTAPIIRRYVRAAYGLQDRYRFRSLDAPRSADDKRTLGETLAA